MGNRPSHANDRTQITVNALIELEVEVEIQLIIASSMRGVGANERISRQLVRRFYTSYERLEKLIATEFLRATQNTDASVTNRDSDRLERA